MAEENKNAAPTEEYNDDGSKNPDYVPPKTGSEGADAGTEKKGADNKDDKGTGEGDDKGTVEFDDTINPEKPPEIPIRKSTAQHIIARKNEKIKKLQQKNKEQMPENNDDGEEDDGEGSGDDTTKDTKNEIGRQVQKTLAPLLDKLANDEDEKELQNLFTTEPESEKYANHIRAYMAHDVYKGVSPAVIYHHLAFTTAQALGVKKKQTADLETKNLKGGGRTIVDNGSTTGLPSAEDIANMSEEEFGKMQENVLQGKFLKN